MQPVEETTGVLDEGTAERIRQYEAARERPAGLRWQVLLALVLGAIPLAAGVTLFVAAHWDELSPATRFIVVMGVLVVLHGGAVLVRSRIDRLSTASHAVGTVAAGAAVALVGQIFNIQEHWPAGVLLWALCALAGWALLDDQVEQTISLLLVPAWFICEWSVRTEGYRRAELMLARMIVVLAAVYLTGFLGSKRRLVSGVLFAAGALVLAVGVLVLGDYSLVLADYSSIRYGAQKPPMPAVTLVFS
jgi:hypothetical protein